MKRQNYLLLLLAVTAMVSYGSSTLGEINALASEIHTSVEGIEGSWAYQVQNVDPQYQNGMLHITKEKGNYALNIQGSGDSLIPTQDLEVEGNEVKFVVYVEGERVAITLSFEGDSFTGNGSSSAGPFTMSGTRKRIPQ
ncbi:MAG: hypothetical protein WBM83_10780 [Flavobacteriaceae bacterium]